MNPRCVVFVMAVLAWFGFARAQDPLEAQREFAARQRTLLKQSFTNFPRVTFLPLTNGNESTIQTIKVRDQSARDDVAGSCGVRFTLPEWLDGDLQWAFFHLNPETQKRQRVNLSWGIMAEDGQSAALRVRRIDPDDSVKFWQRYPFTWRVYALQAARTNLQPGGNYALYFIHSDPDPPDLAFAITIDSERGRKEFGSLGFISGPTGLSGSLGMTPLKALLQENWKNFPVFDFQPPTNGTETVLQRFAPKDHTVGAYLGHYRSGIRFTVPDWMDGDLEVAFLYLFRPPDLPPRFHVNWDIMPERGEFRRPGHAEEIQMSDFPGMIKRFRHTEKAFTAIYPREQFKPGETYLLSWGHTQRIVPDLVVAITIDSDRGRKEFGSIVWR